MGVNGLLRVKIALFSSLLAVAALSASATDVPDKWVRYVEATGSQYVDTGIVGRPGTKAECMVEKACLQKLLNQPTVYRSFDRYGPETGPVNPGSVIFMR